MKLRSIPWLIASVALSCSNSPKPANEPAVVTVPSDPPDADQEQPWQQPPSPAIPPTSADEERCDHATGSLPRTEGFVRVMIWSDGLRCMDGKPVREQDGMRDEAARLVSLGVTGAVLVVDGSVPYGEVVAVMDALMTGGIGEFNFSAAKP